MLNDDDKKFGLIQGASKSDRTREKGKKRGKGDKYGNYFEGTFDPPFPMVEEKFEGGQFVYRASDDKKVISIIGRTPPTEQFRVLLSFVLPRESKTGKYKLGREADGPMGNFLAHVLLKADTGTLEIERDNNRQTIRGAFDMSFEYEGANYRVYGSFFLNATEPL